MTPLQYSLLSALAARGSIDQTTFASDVAQVGSLKRLEGRKMIERPVSNEDREHGFAA